MRLDKLLANMGIGSRKDVKALLKKRKVLVNDVVVKDGAEQVDPETDIITASGKQIRYQKHYYIMLHKPKGVVSATTDDRDKTVIDLVRSDYGHVDLFPVGRLDKDTEGLLLLTNDGELAHQLTSPKKAVIKTYYATIDGTVTDTDIVLFRDGIVLDDGYTTKPAELRILQAGKVSEITVAISEGKYHQVKRMFAAVNKRVTYLKRLTMGSLQLDNQLALGKYRELTKDELTYCKHLKKAADIT
ncbi:pseudouridine synthase [Lentibacillus sp. N15]|uniref:pseudouridine synthase n=1 Tax=Lentibacillus songyuanensis TaxID=3136161 RepID=UPI0031BB63B4